MLKGYTAESSEGTVPNFDMFFRGMRALLFVATYQAAIFCASLLISTTGVSGAVFLACVPPFSWAYFPMGLSYAVQTLLWPGRFPADSAFLSNFPFVTYAGIFIAAIVIRRPTILILLYAIFIALLMVNIGGCVVMPKPASM